MMNQLLMSVLAQRKSKPVSSENYVRFVSAEARTITPKYTNSGVTLQYSVNGGATWNTITSENETTSATEHWFRGQATGTKRLFTSSASTNAWAFSGSSDLELYGNLNFLLCDTLGDKVAPTSLGINAYASMFYGCTSLTTPPELPATTLARYCYWYMFNGCTSLTTAPQLPGTTLANYCYANMFNGCTSLTKAPELPATTLAEMCYSNMFYNCTSLTTAPQLPGTTLANYCYMSMFQKCTSLKVSATQTGSYTYAWRIPTSGTGTEATMWNGSMLSGTGGTFTSNPTIDTTYYVVNKPVGADEYFYYAKGYYTTTNNSELFPSAWQDMKDSETVLFDITLALAAPNQEMGGMTIDLYVGTDGQLQELYDACANATIPPPIDSSKRDVYYVNNVATFYAGDASGDVGFPIPLYRFGVFDTSDPTSFLIGDLTPLSMGLGLVLAKIEYVSIPNNNIVIQQGFEFENESGIILSDSVTSIDAFAFSNWTSNNQPLVIPNSVTSIGDLAFSNWSSNNQPLVIPNSVTSIGGGAFENWSLNNQPLVIPNSVTSIGYDTFSNWTSNNQPLVIPNSVTSISSNAFENWSLNNQPLVIPNSVTSIGTRAFYSWSLVRYVEIQAITPPTLSSASAFDGQNNAPIYVPDESVEAYKTATNWVDLSKRIFSINDK